MAWVSSAARRAEAISESMPCSMLSRTASARAWASAGMRSIRESRSPSRVCIWVRVAWVAARPSARRACERSPASSIMPADCSIRLRASFSRASNTLSAFWPAVKAASPS